MATTSDKKYNTRAAAKKVVAEPVTKGKANKKTTKKETDRKYKNHMSSDEDDSEDDADYVVESEYTETETEDDDDETDTDFICSDGEDNEDQLAEKEYQKFLYGLFPSKYMKDKVSSTTLGGAAGAMLVPADLIRHKKSSNKTCPPAPKKKKACRKIISDDEEEDDEMEEFGEKNKTPTNFNISFVIDDSLGQQYKSSKEALYDEDDYTDEEDADTDTASEAETESDAETESAGHSEADEADEAEKEEVIIKSGKGKKETKKPEAVTDEAAALQKMKDMFSGLSAEERSSSIVKGLLNRLKGEEKQYMKTKEKESKKEKTKNTHKLKSLLREKDVMNDLKYFNEKMSISEQKSVLEQIELIHKSTYTDKPYRLTLLESDIPVNYKASAYRKITTLRHMEPGGGEYYKMKNWVDTFMQIPFGKYRNLPITLDDGVEKCHAFMDNAKQILDQAVYGLNDAKLQIMQMVGQWIVNPGAIGTAIAIKGPMGTGKTTLVKEGISKILGRDFAFIALGGATDSSFLEGHSYTYEGSTWGKIVDLLIKCKSMNPVIYFDELDKISDTPKGEEIAGILTHLTDTSQNNQFHDRYFSEIDFDLSRCLFIFSYNDESKVNRILLDRMYKIQTKGYDQAQKTTIANSYLMPKICEQVKFKTEDIIIEEATMHYIIDNYTEKEDGVRTLKRCLEIIHTKLNLYRLMKPDTNIFEKEMSIKVEFPMTVTAEIVDKLIKKEVDNGAWKNMYM